jgi:AraC-like DNA-binding protein
VRLRACFTEVNMSSADDPTRSSEEGPPLRPRGKTSSSEQGLQEMGDSSKKKPTGHARTSHQADINLEDSGNDKITNPLMDPVILRRLNYYSRLKRLVAYMSMHPKKQISLNLAATVACMGRTAFSRFFKRTVGITFREFVQRWRTGMAVQLMLESDRGLYDVACEVGFHNLSAFERTFKKVTSFTPSEYRRRLLAETQVQVKRKN